MANVVEQLGGTVKAAAVTASGTQAVGKGVRVRGLHIAEGGTAGSVALKDGGSGGDVIATIQTGASSGGQPVVIPGAGMDFATDVYVEFTNVSGVTVFYQ